jgi:hypothetical protein
MREEFRVIIGPSNQDGPYIAEQVQAVSNNFDLFYGWVQRTDLLGQTIFDVDLFEDCDRGYDVLVNMCGEPDPEDVREYGDGATVYTVRL